MRPSREFVSVFVLTPSAVPSRDDLPVVDDRNPLRDTLGFFHIMRGKEYRDAFRLVELLEIAPHMISCLRIETERRLVQK